ncbi:ribonuclease M5 [Cytobacillus gottheilii]|uniref:ribonuclease M5 n=1 Tax=Cytobacillus gottheilii TaxID=859144 RepID=UPI0009BBC1AE|nr:ribonuclease M5 [Cytobacillus gottheilii]
MKIKEIIVVEGKDDTVAIKRALEADTIETNGSAINKDTLERIKHAQEARGVIVLTDPDFPGQKIRQIISEYVPTCKHAFIEKSAAIEKLGRGVGVEHASPDVIREALKHAHVMTQIVEIDITQDDLLEAGLIGGPGAKERREKLGRLLKIGYTNGKQLHKRLTMFSVKKEDLERAIEAISQEENHE